MDKDKDGEVSLSEWLSGTEAIADFVGEEEFLKALLRWAILDRATKLKEMINREMARKKADGEKFAAPGSARLKPPFSVTNRNPA